MIESRTSFRARPSRDAEPSAAWALVALPMAAGDDDGLGKLIFAVIFAVIWGISALSSMLNKKKQAMQRKKLNDLVISVQHRPRPLGSPQRPMPVPPPVREDRPVAFRSPPPLRRQVSPPRQAPKQPQLAAKLVMGPKVVRPPLARAPQTRPQVPRPLQRRPARPAPPVRQVVQEEEGPSGPRLVADTPSPTAAPRPPLPAGQAGHGPPSIAQAAAISKWLTPRTLRQQFILTELLQPPMAFRPPRDV